MEHCVEIKDLNDDNINRHANSEVGKTHEVQTLSKGLQATTDWRQEEPTFPEDETFYCLPNTK